MNTASKLKKVTREIYFDSLGYCKYVSRDCIDTIGELCPLSAIILCGFETIKFPLNLTIAYLQVLSNKEPEIPFFKQAFYNRPIGPSIKIPPLEEIN